MTCAWKELLSILPPGIRESVDAVGKENLEELRLRMNAPPELVTGMDRRWLEGIISREDIAFVVNAATKYSPWTAGTTAQGYITSPGGHRIGLCGEVVCKDGAVSGMRTVSSVCIRVARDFSGIGVEAAKLEGSLLILGSPGRGKTTLLRDLIRQLSQRAHVCVVDERRELFPEEFQKDIAIDLLTGCPKAQGMEMLLKTMGPDYIAVDEITSEVDCMALVRVANCGVKLLATAHASSQTDFRRRSVYKVLREASVFQSVLILEKDRSFTIERVCI